MAKETPMQFLQVPEFRLATERYAELVTEADQLEAERNRLAEQIAAIQTGGLRGDALTVAALALIDGTAADQQVAVSLSEMAARIEEITPRIPIVRRAVQLQKRRLAELEVLHSRRICDGIRPAYLAIVQRLAKAIIELQEAARAEQELRQPMVDGGVRFSSHLFPIVVRGFAPTPGEITRAQQCLEEIRTNYPEVKVPPSPEVSMGWSFTRSDPK